MKYKKYKKYIKIFPLITIIIFTSLTMTACNKDKKEVNNDYGIDSENEEIKDVDEVSFNKYFNRADKPEYNGLIDFEILNDDSYTDKFGTRTKIPFEERYDGRTRHFKNLETILKYPARNYRFSEDEVKKIGWRTDIIGSMPVYIKSFEYDIIADDKDIHEIFKYSKDSINKDDSNYTPHVPTTDKMINLFKRTLLYKILSYNEENKGDKTKFISEEEFNFFFRIMSDQYIMQSHTRLPDDDFSLLDNIDITSVRPYFILIHDDKYIELENKVKEVYSKISDGKINMMLRTEGVYLTTL